MNCPSVVVAASVWNAPLILLSCTPVADRRDIIYIHAASQPAARKIVPWWNITAESAREKGRIKTIDHSTEKKINCPRTQQTNNLPLSLWSISLPLFPASFARDGKIQFFPSLLFEEALLFWYHIYFMDFADFVWGKLYALVVGRDLNLITIKGLKFFG